MVFDGLKDDLVEIWFAVRNSIRVCHEQSTESPPLSLGSKTVPASRVIAAVNAAMEPIDAGLAMRGGNMVPPRIAQPVDNVDDRRRSYSTVAPHNVTSFAQFSVS